MKRTIFAITLLFLLSGQSRAEIMGASSIEWLSCQSEVIVVGKIDKITITKGVHSVIYEECTVQIAEVIKGDIKDKELAFCLRTLSSKPTAKDFMNSNQGVLLFLSRSKGHGPERHLDNKYVPTAMGSPFSIIDLSNVSNDLYSKEMRILTNPEEILKTVRTWADSKVSHCLWWEVPFDSAIFNQLYAGSACYLIVPAEESYRPYFVKLARSDKPHERQRAASELYKFLGQQTEAILRELLKDETENFWNYSADTISKIEYGVRAAACRSLEALGKPVPQIELERKPTEEEQRSLRQGYWRKSFAEALSDEWKVISVEDGNGRQVEGRDTTSVIVTCANGESWCTFTLIPKEWDKSSFPVGENLGTNGRNSQGGRHFLLDGTLPQAVKNNLIRYFGIE